MGLGDRAGGQQETIINFFIVVQATINALEQQQTTKEYLKYQANLLLAHLALGHNREQRPDQGLTRY